MDALVRDKMEMRFHADRMHQLFSLFHLLHAAYCYYENSLSYSEHLTSCRILVKRLAQ